MIISEHVEIKWMGSNKDWYTSKGYIWTKQGDSFLVNINEVSKGCRSLIDIKCDYCECIFQRTYKEWITLYEKSPIKKDACSKCRCLKTKESNLVVYGVENTTQLDCVQDKIATTNLERYGVTNAIQNEHVKRKMQQTNLERYGVEVPAKNKDVIEKTKQTNLERYGSTTYFTSEEGKKKIKSIIREKYGVDSVSQLDFVKAKKTSTMYKNGTTPTSSQQLYIQTLVGGKLNYPFSKSSLDIAFPKEKIYIEYDGGGHNLDVKIGVITQEEFDKKEQRRSFFLKDNGWREIRIISDNDKLPSDDIILDFVEIAKSFIIADKWFSAHWNIAENFVKVNYKYTYSLGEFFNKYKVKEAFR